MSEEKNIPQENSMSDRQAGKNQITNSSQRPADKKEEDKNISQPETQLQTSNIEPQATNMEVHKHPHHVTHKKKWGEYLLEFLMLFLAVFLGFIAENFREHSVEGKKEKEYIKSIVEDLKIDSTNLNFIIYRYMPAVNSWVDSCMSLLESSSSVINERIIYQAVENATLWRHFNPNQRTLTQLKNSGNFILISDRNAIGGILDYDNRLNNYMLLNNTIRIYEHDVDTTQLRFTDYKIVRQIFNIQSSGRDFLSLTDIPINAHLTNFQGDNRKIFSNKLKQMNIQQGIMLGQYQSLYTQSIELIHLLNKEYHLE
jgi:hypothetical protein